MDCSHVLTSAGSSSSCDSRGDDCVMMDLRVVVLGGIRGELLRFRGVIDDRSVVLPFDTLVLSEDMESALGDLLFFKISMM
jgi:hypothetical protein